MDVNLTTISLDTRQVDRPIGAPNSGQTQGHNDTMGISEDSYFPDDYMENMDVSIFSPEVRSALITLYALTTILAFTGNLVVVVTLATGNTLWKLRCFLINLAVSDLLIAIFCLPFTFTKTVIGRWHFGSFMCPFVTFMQYLAVSVSVFTNVAIGFDRYWVVVRPMRARPTAGRVRFVIACIWLAGTSLAAPQLAIGRQDYSELIGYECYEKWTGENAKIKKYIYMSVVLAFSYVIPLIILSVTYGTVGQRLWERTHPGEASCIRDQRQSESKKKVIKMLLVIVIAFGICWLPIHLFSVCIEIWPSLAQNLTASQEQMFFRIYVTCHWIAMAHSFVNPIIYGFLHEKFRKDVWRLLRCFRCRCCCRTTTDVRTSRAFRAPDTNDTFDHGSTVRISRKARSSSTNSSNRSRSANFSLGCGLRRQDTVEDNLESLPLPVRNNKQAATDIKSNGSASTPIAATSV